MYIYIYMDCCNVEVWNSSQTEHIITGKHHNYGGIATINLAIKINRSALVAIEFNIFACIVMTLKYFITADNKNIILLSYETYRSERHWKFQFLVGWMVIDQPSPISSFHGTRNVRLGRIRIEKPRLNFEAST